MKRRFTLLVTGAACAAWLGAAAPARSAAHGAQGRVLGIAFVGRMVSNLDRSVAFYEALGFREDPAASTAWRKDDVIDRLYGIRGAATRRAKMFVTNANSGHRFVVYLRQLKGVPRRDLSRHTAWTPGSSHFALVVPHANRLWARLKASGMLRARSWGGRLIPFPGQTRGAIAYITDPDGLDIELVNARTPAAAAHGRPARAGLTPGVNHVGLVVLDSARERAFYGGVLGGRLVSKRSPWLKGAFYDAAVGGHGNVLRFSNESFPFVEAPGYRMNFELVEFRNRRGPVPAARLSDIGVGYVGFEVDGLAALLARARASGARMVSDGILTLRGGTRVAMIRDPDVGGFIELVERARNWRPGR